MHERLMNLLNECRDKTVEETAEHLINAGVIVMPCVFIPDETTGQMMAVPVEEC